MFAMFEQRRMKNQNKERSNFLRLVSLGLSRYPPLHELGRSIVCLNRSIVAEFYNVESTV